MPRWGGKLKDAALKEEKLIQRTEACIKICEEYNEKLRQLILKKEFASQADV